MGGIADFKLRGVDSHGESSGTGFQIISNQGPLVAGRPAPVSLEGERHRRDDLTLTQVLFQMGKGEMGHAGERAL